MCFLSSLSVFGFSLSGLNVILPGKKGVWVDSWMCPWENVEVERLAYGHSGSDLLNGVSWDQSSLLPTG